MTAVYSSYPLGWGFALVALGTLGPICAVLCWAMWRSDKWRRR